MSFKNKFAGILDFGHTKPEDEGGRSMSVEEQIENFDKSIGRYEEMSFGEEEETAQRSSQITNENKRMLFYKPSSYDSVQEIADQLKDDKAVFIDFADLNEEESVKVKNFFFGICYWEDIKMEKLRHDIVSIDPLFNLNR